MGNFRSFRPPASAALSEHAHTLVRTPWDSRWILITRLNSLGTTEAGCWKALMSAKDLLVRVPGPHTENGGRGKGPRDTQMSCPSLLSSPQALVKVKGVMPDLTPPGL